MSESGKASSLPTAAALLAGRPVLQIPLVLEQRLTAAATVRLGAGEVAAVRDGDAGDVERKLGALVSEERSRGRRGGLRGGTPGSIRRGR